VSDSTNPIVSAAWEKVVESWDDSTRHDALRALAVQHHAIAWVAKQYKQKGDEVATTQLQKLQGAALAAMMAASTARKDPEKSPYRRGLMWIMVLVLMLLLGLLAAKLMVRPHHPAQP
jgi:hypothetical protein